MVSLLYFDALLGRHLTRGNVISSLICKYQCPTHLFDALYESTSALKYIVPRSADFVFQSLLVNYTCSGYQLCIYFSDTIRHALSVGYTPKNAYALIKNVRIINKTDKQRTIRTRCEQTTRSRLKKIVLPPKSICTE